MNFIVAIDVIAQRGNEQCNLKIYRKRLRDASDPFSLPEEEFRLIYRLSRETAWILVRDLEPHMPRPQRASAIPQQLQVLATVSFLASGSYQKRIGQDFITSASQPAISRAIHATVDALNVLMAQWIKFPTEALDIQRVKDSFLQNTGFPGIIGAIDGTHVAIVPPSVEREQWYINRKLYHSLNVLIVSDYDGKILFVNAGHGGRTHDARVWHSSILSPYLARRYRNGERETWILGDSAYPLLPYLLTPKLNQPDGTPSARYTARHVIARSAVERCFGRLKGTWRCLRKERALHYTPEFAALIVNACCVLQNMYLHWRLGEDHYHFDDIDQFPAQVPVGDAVNIRRDGARVREQLIEEYFTL